MRTLIISDVHANEPALKAVLQDAGCYDRLVFLGDLANFGPHPAQCVDILKKLNPICIMGNHDEQIVTENPDNFWDEWSRKRLSSAQLEWMSSFHNSYILDGHILLVHGSYSVDYDILPNTPDREIKAAFDHLLTPQIDQVWFGHYHYQVDRVIDNVEYHCIRPVGHHRDKDTRSSYYVCENGVLTQKRVEYELSRTIEDFNNIDAFEDLEKKNQFAQLLKNAFHEELLQKDLAQMRINETTAE